MSINWRNTIWDGEDFLSTPACRIVKEDSIQTSGELHW